MRYRRRASQYGIGSQFGLEQAFLSSGSRLLVYLDSAFKLKLQKGHQMILIFFFLPTTVKESFEYDMDIFSFLNQLSYSLDTLLSFKNFPPILRKKKIVWSHSNFQNSHHMVFD